MGVGDCGQEHGRQNAMLRAIVSSGRLLHIRRKETPMAQTDNPFLDGMAKMFTDAAGMAQGVRAEIDTFVKQRLERLVADMDFVPREEFDAVKAMAARARAENEALAARLSKLEAGALESKSGT